MLYEVITVDAKLSVKLKVTSGVVSFVKVPFKGAVISAVGATVSTTIVIESFALFTA